MKLMLVPQTDIDMIEQCRKDLHDIIGNLKDEKTKEYLNIKITTNVTSKLWKIAHRKYKQSFWNFMKNNTMFNKKIWIEKCKK